MALFSCAFYYLLNMAKIFRKTGLSENSFEAGTAGSAGSINYSTGWGTPAGGNTSQSPDKFKSSNSSTQNAGHYKDNIEETGSRMPERPDRKSSSGAPIHPGDMTKQGDEQPGDDPSKPNTVPFDSGGQITDDNASTTDPDTNNNNNTFEDPNDEYTADDEEYYPDGKPAETPDSKKGEPLGRSGDVSPGGKYQNATADKPIDPTKGLDKQVDKIFTKKITPTPDDILSALQWEMTQMVKKDKYIAKQIVLRNLKTDPKYYTRLNMLNIDDDKMKVDENTTFSKTKAVLDQMISDRKTKSRPVQNSAEINTIFDELWNKRHNFNSKKS